MISKRGIIVVIAIWMIIISNTFSFHTLSQQDEEDSPLHSGVITGRVINAEGETVIGAEVFAERVGVIDRFPYIVRTNVDGEFTIRNVAPGTYRLHSAERKGGYPGIGRFYTLSGYFENLSPEVTLLENDVIRDVVVPIGARAGRLIVRLVDATTNEPVDDAQVILRRTDNPENNFMNPAPRRGIIGEFEFLTPPVPFTIEVEASGYENSQYGRLNPNDQAETLQLALSEARELTIALRPLR